MSIHAIDNTSAPAMLHRQCGAPRVDACADVTGTCWLCGASFVRGVARDGWLPDTFTSQNRVRGGHHLTHVCEACAWVTSRAQGVVPGAPPAHNWRLYSVLVDGAEMWRGNKGDKPAILAWLRAPKRGAWFAAIADSGQKHVIPFAPVNPAGSRRGRVQFEDDVLTLGDFGAVDKTAALLTAGATKDSIATGHYTPGEVQRCGWDRIHEYEFKHASTLRGSPWFRLAVWLAQRDEAAVANRMEAEKHEKARRTHTRDGAKPDGVRAPRSARGVPRQRRERAETLGSDARPSESGGANLIDGGRVAHDGEPVIAAREPDQRGLFDVGGTRVDSRGGKQ